ncbi:MAG: hypothetical protein ABSF60_16255, partial [Verrucomicrobiota bacterium]
VTRRNFLRYSGIASSALTFSPFFLERLTAMAAAAPALTRVYKVMNGADCFQNVAKLWQLLGGPAQFIGATDIVVIKANAQWPNQGYTHTGCIKAVIDAILTIPGFSGEVLLCDNIQGGGLGSGNYGFDATAGNRVNNWPTMNWIQLAASYQSLGQPVALVQWQNDINWRSPQLPLPSWSVWNPASGPGWTRYFLNYSGRNTYISSPVFQSPLTPGRMIDMKNGVWENGSYTGRKVKAIFMPTLNNHDYSGGSEDYAGITSAVKSFYGATEIFHGSPTYISDDYVWNGYYSIHSSSFTQSDALAGGTLVGNFINNLYAPVLYITSAIYSGWFNRTATNGAAYTNTVLACTNPVTLDYVACRDVISPYAAWLNPDLNNNTRKQILGCNSQGIGTIDPSMFEIVTYDFNHPTTTRLEIDQKVHDFKAGTATQQDVKDVISQYMQGQ